MSRFAKYLLVLLVLASLQLAAQDINSADSTLRELFDAGRYDEASALLEDTARNNPSFSVLYNLGVVAEVQQESGASMLYYLRARAINPRHEQLNGRLSTLLTQLDETDIQDTGWQLADTIEQGLNTGEHAAFALAMWGLFCASLVVMLVVRNYRDAARIAALFLAGLLIVALGTFTFRRWYATERPLAVVMQSNTVMSGPANDYFSLGVIPEGVPVRILSRRDEYVLIQTRSGRTGWINRDSVENVGNNRAAS